MGLRFASSNGSMTMFDAQRFANLMAGENHESLVAWLAVTSMPELWTAGSASCGPATPIRGQMSASGQTSHFGLRARQICRPCGIMRWLKSIHSRLGNWAIRSRSIFTASVCRGQAQPPAEPGDVRVDHHAGRNAKGRAQHHVGRLAAHARQLDQRVEVLRHLAAVIARPARVQQALMFLALLRKKPVLWMARSSSASLAAANGRASGYLLKQLLGDDVHPRVGALGRKDRGHEQFAAACRKSSAQRASG